MLGSFNELESKLDGSIAYVTPNAAETVKECSNWHDNLASYVLLIFFSLHYEHLQLVPLVLIPSLLMQMLSFDKRLFIYRNETASEGKVMTLKTRESILKLKKIASRKLSVKAKRVFLANGSEVVDVDSLQNNDTLYISEGEPFYKTAAQGNGQQIMNISVLGSGGVGKSAVTLRFVREYFVKDWDPTIEDAYRKQINIDDDSCMLEILDTAGQDDFESLRAQWMMDKDGYVFVYSMDSRGSLREMQTFFELHLQLNGNKNPSPPIILVANKKDLVDQDPSLCQVTTEQGRRFARFYSAKYIETSALTGENVSAVFETLVCEARRQKVEKPPRSTCVIL
uniref:Raslike protein putative n=1 Tax=Albugo laibachii Nc14 TaxID=890382 RepID=F0WFE8_9STRA|nr:raslike protein putative [Albugo laibachii Nc14]|eukprot:CCA19930.1 raslike protein putative [Albugo laibachii Nc14]